MLEKLRADWRRGRALKSLKLGERQYWEWDSNSEAGVLCAHLRFDAEGDVLVLRFGEIYAKDPDRTKPTPGAGGVERADLGIRGAFDFVALVAGLADDAGFKTLQVRGQRMTLRRKAPQSVDFDVARFRRSPRPRR